MHRGGAVTAIQYPEHKVLPNLTQGHKRIWTHEWGHKLRGAGFISFPSAPAQPSPSFILDFVFWSRIFCLSSLSWWKIVSKKEHRGNPARARGLDQRLIGKGMKGKWAMARCAGTCCSNPASPRQTCAALVNPPPRLPPAPSSLRRIPFQSSSSSSSLTLLHKSHTKNPHAHTLKNRISMSLPWPWGEVSNISFQGDNDSSFNSPYFTVCPNEYTAWVILIEHQPASGIMTLTVLSRFDDLMTMDLLIYPEICSTSFIKT